MDLVARLRAAGCVRAEDEAALLTANSTGPDLEAAVRRREAGDPLEQILGWAEFCGLRITLLPGVFVPRQRSTLLVGAAVTGLTPGLPILDVCCGSGALGAAVHANVPESPVYATDIDPDAVACARLNLPADHVFEGDLFDAVPPELEGMCGVVIAHVPYIPTPEIPLIPREFRDHEHTVALDGGPDGLDVARRLLAGVPDWLAPGGSVLFECAPEQRDGAGDLVTAAGLVPQVIDDDSATVVVGVRPTSTA